MCTKGVCGVCVCEEGVHRVCVEIGVCRVCGPQGECVGVGVYTMSE